MATMPSRASIGAGSIVVVGLLAIAAYVVVLAHLWSTSAYDTWGGMLIGPILFAVSLPALARQARREGDSRVFWILLAALVAKLVFALVRYHFAFEVYDKADARRYNEQGAELARHFLAGNFDIPAGDRDGGTRFIEIVTGLTYTVTRPTVVGGFMVFSWLGFWGQYFFYRAFHLGVPEGRTRSYAFLLFFLPSMLYWPAGIGKESWMMLTLGIAAFGAARVLTGSELKGLAILVGAFFLAIQVRPHYPAFMAVAVGIAYLVRKRGVAQSRLGPAGQVVALAALLVISLFLIGKTEDLLGTNLSGIANVEAVLRDTAQSTEQGGSQYAPVNVASPVGAPLAAFTVLFRPLVIEANNINAIGAALEGTLLLGLTILRWQWILAALRSLRRQPYVVFSLVYLVAGIVALSAIGNFGILARQRVLIFPAFLVLLSIPPLTKRFRDQPEREEAHAPAEAG